MSVVDVCVKFHHREIIFKLDIYVQKIKVEKKVFSLMFLWIKRHESTTDTKICRKMCPFIN